MAEFSGRNPKIELDSGGVVWGCECYWGPADDADVARFVKGRQVVVVSPEARDA